MAAPAPSSEESPCLPSLAGLHWRTDVIISSSEQRKVMRPSLTFRVDLTDGTGATFECSVQEFHRLRHAVAQAMDRMNQVEKNPVVQHEKTLRKSSMH